MDLPSSCASLARLLAVGGLAVALAGCPHSASLPVEAGIGPDPELVPPRKEAIPTVHIAPARGWADGEAPAAAPGLVVTRFAEGLDHPRWLHVLPNGDVLVAETNAPERPARKGLKVWLSNLVMKRAGAAVPSAERITLLRDADGDGVAEVRSPFLAGLKSPFGMALLGDSLFVANTDAVVRVPYVAGDLRSQVAEAEKVVDLPAGARNHHWTKDLIAHPDGKRLFATVGSNSNVAEHGMQEEADRASVLEIDLASRGTRVFASGLRNPNGLAWNPVTGELWVAVNERDELGGDLVPDYMTSVRENGFYGWPYSYFGQHVDVRAQPPRPDLVASAIKPDYALGSHTASLGLAFHQGDRLGEFREGAFVGQHGSWNRRPRSGYKVIFVPFQDGKPAGAAVDVLTGFVDEDGQARGRPVGVAIDRRGALLVADDVGNVVWRVSGTAAAGAPATASPGPPSTAMR